MQDKPKSSKCFNTLQSIQISSFSNLDIFEENYNSDTDSFSLLSPNSKVSRILTNSKRISKKTASVSRKTAPQTPSSIKSPLKSSKKRNAWTTSEDKKVLELFGQYGTKWAKIASSLGNRTGKQVRDRYLGVLVSDISKSLWTEEEDNMILEMLEKIGNQWRKISECLQGRTEIQVKNRYYTYLKRLHGKQSGKGENKEDSVEEVNTEASPKVFDPTDMISYQEEKQCEKGVFTFEGML